MRVFALLSLVGCLLVPLISRGQIGVFPRLDALAASYAGRPQARGLSAAILYNGTVHYAGYGRLSAKEDRAPDERTIYEIGALSGVFTTGMLAVLESKGALEPVATIRQILPEGATVPAYTATRLVAADSLAGLDPQKQVVCMPDPIAGVEEVTLCQLAYHSSGLKFPGKLLLDWHPLAPATPPQKAAKDLASGEALIRLAGQCTFEFPPGTQFGFSNMGIAYLGSLLAAYSREPYEQLLKKNITDPLEMTDTRAQLPAALLERLAPGHDSRGRLVTNWDFQAMLPAVGLKSTARDMMRLVRALVEPSPPFTENAASRIRQGTVPTHLPGWPRTGSAALGWLVSTDENNRAVVWMSGATAGYRAFAAFDPQRKTGIVLLANSAQDLTELGFAMLRAL